MQLTPTSASRARGQRRPVVLFGVAVRCRGAVDADAERRAELWGFFSVIVCCR
jgi:hypothetical protein